MSTLTDDVATARALQDDLKTAVRALGNPGVGTYLTSLNDVLNPALDDPASVDQSGADAIGSALINMRAAAAGYADVATAEAALHDFMSQAMVTHRPDLDWYEAAQQAPNTSGGKHKPD